MSKLASKTIKWTPSSSQDVVAHKVYVAQGAVDYNSPSQNVPIPLSSYVIPGAFASLAGQQGSDWHIMVTAVDDVGNESDGTHIGPVTIDFLAPAAPTGVQLI